MFEILTEHFGSFSSGLWVTIRLVAASLLIALVLGTLVAALRVASTPWLQRVGGVYVEIFRNIPLLVLLFISFAGFRRAGLDINAWTAGIASLGVYTSAYVAEALRSGVFSVSRGQREAALSLGLNRFLTYRLVIIPQALALMMPSFGNLLIELIKATSLVSLITLTDLTFSGRQMVVTTGQTTLVWALVLVIYFAISYPLTFLVRRAERRAARFR